MTEFNGDGRIDLKPIADQVRDAVDGYVVSEHRPDQLGTPLPPEWFERGLIEMRAALVEPYWAEMRDYDAVSRAVVRRSVVVVADDGDGSLVMFDPGAGGDFALALREGGGIVSCGVRGDAVGCFLAR